MFALLLNVTGKANGMLVSKIIFESIKDSAFAESFFSF